METSKIKSKYNNTLEIIYKHIIEIESFTKIIAFTSEDDYMAIDSEDFVNTMSLLNEKINMVKANVETLLNNL